MNDSDLIRLAEKHMRGYADYHGKELADFVFDRIDETTGSKIVYYNGPDDKVVKVVYFFHNGSVSVID